MSDSRTRIVPLEMLGNGRTPMMTIGRERAAIAAMSTLRAMGADVVPTHQLVNGLGFIAPDTGTVHGPETRLIAIAPWQDINGGRG